MALTAHKLPSIAVRSSPSAADAPHPSIFSPRYPYCAYGEVIFGPFVLQLPFDWPILIEKFCILMEFFTTNFRFAYGFMNAVDKAKVHSEQNDNRLGEIKPFNLKLTGKVLIFFKNVR